MLCQNQDCLRRNKSGSFSESTIFRSLRLLLLGAQTRPTRIFGSKAKHNLQWKEEKLMLFLVFVRWRKIAVFHLISKIYLVYYGGLLIYSVSKNVPIFIRFTHTRVSLILIMFSHYIKQYSAYPKIFTVSVLFCKYIIVLFFCLMYAI